MELLFQRTRIRDSYALCPCPELWLKRLGGQQACPSRLQRPGLHHQPHVLLLLCLRGSKSLALAPGRREDRGQVSLAFPRLEPLTALAWTSGHSGPGEEDEEGLRGDLGSLCLHLQRAERSQEPKTKTLASPPFQTACLVLVPSTRQVPEGTGPSLSVLQDGQ